MSDELTWADYYDENEDREPRELLLEALSRFGSGPHDAVFRRVLGEPTNAASQLRATLPEAPPIR